MWDTFLAKMTGTEVDIASDRNVLFVRIINILLRCSGIWAVLMCDWPHMVHEERHVCLLTVYFAQQNKHHFGPCAKN